MHGILWLIAILVFIIKHHYSKKGKNKDRCQKQQVDRRCKDLEHRKENKDRCQKQQLIPKDNHEVFMFGVDSGYLFEYKGKLMPFGWRSYFISDVLYMCYCISDYREITEEERKYIDDIGVDLVKVNYDDPPVYKDFSCLEDAIKKNDEYRLSMNWGKSHELYLYKKIDLKDITAFYHIDSFLQIQGMKFYFEKTLCFKAEDYLKDKFDVWGLTLTAEQILTLKRLGCEFGNLRASTRDYPPTCRVPFDAIDGFVIEKQKLDVNDYASGRQKRPIGEKEIYFLDKENPDPELWKMLKSLIYDMRRRTYDA